MPEPTPLSLSRPPALPPVPCQTYCNKSLVLLPGLAPPTVGLTVQEHLINERRDRRRAGWNRPIQPYNNRSADALIANGKNLSDVYGADQIGFLTLTFRPGTTLKKARKLFGDIWKNHLRHRFLACISVLDLNKSGVPHIHALVALDFDIAEGFDFGAYQQMREQNRERVEAALHGQTPMRRRFKLTTNKRLKGEWRWLRRFLKNTSERAEAAGKAGLAPRFELCPLIEGPEAAVKYLAKAYYATRRATHRKIKGLRMIAYSGDCRRCCSSTFALVKNIFDRRQYKRIGEALAVTEHTIGAVYEHWAYHRQEVIEELEVCHGCDPDQWSDQVIRKVADRLMPLTWPWWDSGRPGRINA